MISDRPAEIDDRAVPGHSLPRQGIAQQCPERGEGDPNLSLGSSSIGTLVESTPKALGVECAPLHSFSPATSAVESN